MLKRNDMVYSHWDIDEGRVSKAMRKGHPRCQIDLTLARVSGATRDTAQIFKRIYSGDIVYTYTQRSTNGLGFHHRIRRYPFKHVQFPSYSGFYYWLTSTRRRYNPSGGFTSSGTTGEDLIAASVSGSTVFKRDIAGLLPDDPVPGIEDLFKDVVDIETVIPELDR